MFLTVGVCILTIASIGSSVVMGDTPEQHGVKWAADIPELRNVYTNVCKHTWAIAL